MAISWASRSMHSTPRADSRVAEAHSALFHMAALRKLRYWRSIRCCKEAGMSNGWWGSEAVWDAYRFFQGSGTG